MSPTPVGGPPPNAPAQAGAYDYSRYTGETSQAVAQESSRVGSGEKSDIFIPEAIGDFPRYKPSLGVKVFDIVMGPAGSRHPMVVNGRIRPDDLVHTCWAYIHKSLGANQGWFICPSRTYNKRCPACEERAKIMGMSNLTDAQVKKAIEPYASGKNPLGLYNVFMHQNHYPQQMTWQGPVMWWDITYAYMESVLQSKANSEGPMEDPPTGYISYFWPTAGPQGGRHIKVEVIQDGQWFKYTGHAFYKRAFPVPPQILQMTRPLSEFLYIGNDWDSYYDEIKQAVEVVIDVQQQGQAGAGQPTGEGVYAGPPAGGYDPGGGQQVFGTPPPQRGMFPECEPFGSRYGDFEECNGCSVKVQCYNESPASRQQALPTPGIDQAAQPADQGLPGVPPPAPGPAAPPRAPIPRRTVT